MKWPVDPEIVRLMGESGVQEECTPQQYEGMVENADALFKLKLTGDRENTVRIVTNVFRGIPPVYRGDGA